MKLIPYITGLLLGLLPLLAAAQAENTALRKGNQLYKKGAFDQALPEYEKAASQNPANPIAQFNLGNAQFRKQDFAAAEKSFAAAIDAARNETLKQKAWYNKGVALSKQQKLQESIEAYKNALKMDATDDSARTNLQKALSELKKRQDQQNQNQQQEEKPQQKQQQKNKPQPRQSKLDKRKIEQYLKSLQQKEQEVQQKIQQNRSRAASQPDKDW